MEKGVTSGKDAIQVQNKTPTGEPRLLVPQIRVDGQWDQDPTARAAKANEPQSLTRKANGRDDVGAGSAECNWSFEGSQLSASTAAGPMVQEALNDEPQLATEGIRQVTVEALFELLKAQNHRCALSGRCLTPGNVVLDHIKPFSVCSDHSMANVQLVVREANQAKGCMSNDDFIQLCRDVAARYPPPGLLDSSAA
jgi:hypothetical protein